MSDWSQQFITFHKPGEEEKEKPKVPAPDVPAPLKEFFRRAPNIANMAYAGQSFGGMFGPYGRAAGGLAGGLAGAFQKPSEHPLTDVGALAGDVASQKVLPGWGGLKRMLKGTAGVAGGAAIGQLGDKKADFIVETDYGPIALYSGITAASLGLTSLIGGRTAAASAAEKLTRKTREPVPLSVTEATGKMESVEGFFLRGSSAQRKLGEAQVQAGLRSLEDLSGVDPRLSEEVISSGMGGFQAFRRIVKTWELQNPRPTAVPAGDTAEGLAKAAKGPQKKLPYPWHKFDKKYGLTKKERDAFMVMGGLGRGKKGWAQFVDALAPGAFKESKQTSLYALRAMRKMVDARALPAEDFAKVGKAVLMRGIAKAVKANPDIPSGAYIKGEQFHEILTKEFGRSRLEAIFGRERTNALFDLAAVMRGAKAEMKAGIGPGEVMTQKQRMVSYLANKYAFAAVIGGGAGQAGIAMGGAVQGAAAGLAAIVPLSLMMSKLLVDPHVVKYLVQAHKGNTTAATALLRSLFGQDEETVNLPDPSPITSWLR